MSNNKSKIFLLFYFYILYLNVLKMWDKVKIHAGKNLSGSGKYFGFRWAQ